MKSIFLILLILFGCNPIPASDPGAYPESKSEFSGFTRSLNAKSSHGYRIVSVPDPIRAGEFSERFELRLGDCTGVPSWNDCTNDRERTELKQKSPYAEIGAEHWYSWSIYFPIDYPNIFPVKVALGQFHQEGQRSPPLMFQNGKGGYWVDLNQLEIPPVQIISEEQLRGRWHDILLNVKWGTSAAAFLKIWVNGVEVFERKGPNTKFDIQPYFKYGIYRSFLSRSSDKKNIPPQIVYFDEIRWGRTRKSVEVPNGLRN